MSSRAILSAVVLCLIACGERQPDTRSDSGQTSRAATPQTAALESAAAEVTSFLTGDADFDALSLADTVELLVVPEGGGARRRVSRDALRERSQWRVGEGASAYSFEPSRRLTQMTLRAGRHLNCREYALATKVPALASFPHVGVRLEPPESRSCLEGWNATFVFDTAGGSRPRLIAAVYDQWEW